MEKPTIFGYKPSGLAYTEMVLLIICFLIHFMPLASITINGEEVFSFAPFKTFGTAFAISVFALITATIVMKFIGRFTGLSLMVAIHMGILAYGASVAMEQARQSLEKLKAFGEFARGLSNAFGTSGAVSSTGSTITTSSEFSVFPIILCLTILLVILIFLSWFECAGRLASEHRRSLARGYYVGILGYLLVGVVATLIVVNSYDNINAKFSNFGNIMDGAASVYTMGIGIVLTLVMLLMLIVNLVVVLLLELLREWQGYLKWVLPLFIAAVFVAFFFTLLTIEDNLMLPSPFDGLDNFFNQSTEEIGKWITIALGKCVTIVGFFTCLLRAVYYGFFYDKEAKADTNELATTESEANETTESEEVEVGDDNIVEIPESETDNRKKLYIGGGVLAAILVALGLWFAFSNSSSNNPLGVEKPTWNKFIVVISQDVPLHKDARSDSPKLMQALENLGSDMAAREFRWEDQGKKRGYTLYPYNLEKNAVLPVLDETDTWYKVQVYNEDMNGMIETAYIKKEWTREIFPEPITEEVLVRIGKTMQRIDHIVKSGKLKNLCLTTRFNDLDGESFQIGGLIDGVLVYPQYKGIFLKQEGISGVDLQKDEEYDNYILTYGEDCQIDLDEYSKVFNPQKLTDEKTCQIFETVNQVNPSAPIVVEYYFPEANKDYFFKFAYIAGQSNANVSTADNNAEVTNVTGYHAENRGDGQVLFAEFGSVKEETEVDFLGPLIEVVDLDGDGNMDAFVQDGMPGSSGIYYYSVVYYDKTVEKFKTTEDNIETMSDSPTIVDWENRKCIAVSDGIQIERYVLETPKIKKINTEKGDVGKIVVEIPIERVFDMSVHDTEYTEREVSADINGDGIDETIVFSHSDARGYALGDYMGLERIRWADGSFTDSFGALYTGDKFAFLQNKTNGLPDILVRESYLFRWNGSAYEQWNWNGTEFVKASNLEQ